MRKLTITIEHDEDVENPCEDGEGMWQLYSFNSRHVRSKDPYEFFNIKSRDDFSPKSIGLRRKLKVGLAFVLAYYEHGLCKWMRQANRSGPDWQWDGTDLAGILIWEESPSNIGAKTYEDRAKDADSFLEMYTEWCNGHCYYFKIEDEDGEEIASCGGFIGSDSVVEAIQDEIEEDDEIVSVEGDGAWLQDHHDFKKPVPVQSKVD